MNRHLNILDHTLRSVFSRLSTHLPSTAIFITVVFLAASLILTLQSLLREADVLLNLSPEITVQNMMGGRQVPVDETMAEAIKPILGVKEVWPRLWGYLYDPYSGANFTLWGLDSTTIQSMAGVGFKFIDGVFFRPEERGKIVVGAKVPGVLKLNGRKNITLTDASGKPRNFEIVGVFKTASSLLTADLIIMHRDDLRDFFQMPPNAATDIVVSVGNPAEIAMVASKISRLLPSSRTVSRSQVKRTYEAVFNFRGGIALYLWMGCLLAFLILLWNKGRVELAVEKKELGILKALGWGAKDVLEMKLMEAVLISTFSFAVGFVAAYIHVFFFGAVLIRPVIFGWSVLYPDFHLVPAISGGAISLVFMITVLPYIAVSLLPAWKSASVDAVELMRGEY